MDSRYVDSSFEFGKSTGHIAGLIDNLI